jgi:hypothetical protein
LPGAEDARQEAPQVCCDMIRDIIASLEANPEWRLEVTDESGELIYLFRFTAESFQRLGQHKSQSRAYCICLQHFHRMTAMTLVFKFNDSLVKGV